jgi:branched-chain amino acid aminotransferase
MKNIEWSKLPFGYQKTNYNARVYYKNGKWGEIEISDSEFVNIHIAATGMHYGQEAFEGMKAFKGKDGKTRVFRWEENAKRMANSAQELLMAEVPADLFKEVVFKAIQSNEEFIPPYGSGASLYIRPLLFGSGPKVGVQPADEYLFMVFVTPVGPYFKTGFKPVNMLVTRKYDRAAPKGTGHVKAGGNYGAGLRAIKQAHDGGYANVLFLDALENKYIDECGPANFFGIKNNTYITPKSPTILPSITNMSLMTLAEEIGLKVERRQVPIEELSSFEETGACGTAAIISPIGKIVDEENNKEFVYSKDGNPGPVSEKLYQKLLSIQYGDEPDKFGWVEFVE